LASGIPSSTVFSTDVCSGERNSKHVEVHDRGNWLPKRCKISLQLSNPMLNVLATASEGASAHDERSCVIKWCVLEGRSENIIGSLSLHVSHEWMSVILFIPRFWMRSIQSNSSVIQVVFLWDEWQVEGWFVCHVGSVPGCIPWCINSFLFESFV